MEEHLPKWIAQALGAAVLITFVLVYAGRRMRDATWRRRAATAGGILELLLAVVVLGLLVWVLAVFPDELGTALVITGVILGFWALILGVLALLEGLGDKLRGLGGSREPAREGPSAPGVRPVGRGQGAAAG